MENSNKTNMIPDEKLKDVSGGLSTGLRKGPIKLTLTNKTTYESGDTPKYHKGQVLKIRATDYEADYKPAYIYLTCTVEDVSEEHNCGMIYKEFGYTVRIHRDSELIARGVQETYDGVYESCLYEL